MKAVKLESRGNRGRMNADGIGERESRCVSRGPAVTRGMKTSAG